MTPPKAEIVAALRAHLAEELAALERVAAMSRDEATSDQTRPEGKYDTRATEASYLAHGLAMRIAELRQIVAWFDQEPVGHSLRRAPASPGGGGEPTPTPRAPRALPCPPSLQGAARQAPGDAEPGVGRVQVGALVALERSPGALLFLAPAGGGRIVAHGYAVTVISPVSPLGRALAGLGVGDAVEVETPRGTQIEEIVGVW